MKWSPAEELQTTDSLPILRRARRHHLRRHNGRSRGGRADGTGAEVAAAGAEVAAAGAPVGSRRLRALQTVAAH